MTLARDLSLSEGTHHGDGAVQRRGHVREAGPRPNRGNAFPASDAHQPRERLGNRVEGGVVLVWAVVEPFDGAVDEVRVDGGEIVVSDPQSFRSSGGKVLDEYVGLGDEALEHRQALFRLQVQRDAFLVTIQVVERTVADRTGAADGVPTGGVFHLHDVGPEVGEKHRAERSGDDVAQLDDSDVREWSL